MNTTKEAAGYFQRLASDDDAIVCPAWCTVTKDEHRAEMWQQEGEVDHRTEFGWVKLSHMCYPDGTERDNAEGPQIDTDYYGFSPDEIPQLVADLLAAMNAADGKPVRQRQVWQAWCLGCGWGTDHDSYGSASDATRAHHCAEPDTEVRGPTNVRGVRPIMRGLDDEEAAAEVQLDDGQGDHIADGAATDSIRPRGRRKESATR